MALDISRLEFFIKVAELGSLSKAAVALDTVQSTLSRHIAALEKECSQRLFDRTGRGVTLTAFGKRIFPLVKKLVVESKELESAMKGKDELPVGEVRIGLMPSLAEVLVATLFKKVRERYPSVRLHIFEGSNGQLDEWVSSGYIDIGVLYRYGKSTRRNEESLFKVDTYLVGPPRDKITSQSTVNFAKLDGLPLVLPGVPNGLRVALDHLARRQKSSFSLTVAMEADSLPIQRTMASHGEAYAVHGGVVVWRDVKAGVVSAARIVNPSIKRTMVLATTTNRPLALAGREVSKLLREVCESFAAEGVFSAPSDARLAKA